jgi:hypothetical protein
MLFYKIHLRSKSIAFSRTRQQARLFYFHSNLPPAGRNQGRGEEVDAPAPVARVHEKSPDEFLKLARGRVNHLY